MRQVVVMKTEVKDRTLQGEHVGIKKGDDCVLEYCMSLLLGFYSYILANKATMANGSAVCVDVICELVVTFQ